MGVLLTGLVVALAGCADEPGGEDAAPVVDEDEGGQHGMFALFTGEPDVAPSGVSQQFTGRFEFQDNAQYTGEVANELGQDWTNAQTHDVSGLLTPGAPFAIAVTVQAETGDGDIDVWLEHDGLIASQSCDCPYGGYSHLTAYGTGATGPMILVIQFDEVHDDETDTEPPVEGFDYTIDVAVTSDPRMIPPGVPFAVSLDAAGDHVMFANATEPITVFGPDDQFVVQMEAGSSYHFEVEDEFGEYVFVQAFGGTPATVRFGTSVGSEPPMGRLLETSADVEEVAVQGEAGELAFEVPQHALEAGACGFTDGPEATPSFTLLQPDGSTLGEVANTGFYTGWGVCYGTDLSAGPIQPGSWTAQYAGAAPGGGSIYRWVVSYDR